MFFLMFLIVQFLESKEEEICILQAHDIILKHKHKHKHWDQSHSIYSAIHKMKIFVCADWHLRIFFVTLNMSSFKCLNLQKSINQQKK